MVERAVKSAWSFGRLRPESGTQPYRSSITFLGAHRKSRSSGPASSTARLKHRQVAPGQRNQSTFWNVRLMRPMPESRHHRSSLAAVADSDLTRTPGCLSVGLNSAEFTCPCGERARLEESGGPEPAIVFAELLDDRVPSRSAQPWLEGEGQWVLQIPKCPGTARTPWWFRTCSSKPWGPKARLDTCQDCELL